ncbi:RNA polymerase sigma factor [Ochrobactrum sp. EDr1-4]|uniref:RNA polymerase sigma factor n=1 Tax=Ochrobactrum sp. EDr1-4 TaxID=3368622 RepID=UPI003BA3400B
MIKEVNFKKWNCQTRCSHYPSRVLGRLAQSVEMNNWSHRLTLLFQDHRKRLEAIVTRMTRDKEAAADIVQDVFSKVVDGGFDKSQDENVKILYVATRNASIDHIRTSRRRREIMELIVPEQISGSVLSPEKILEGRQSLEKLDAILMELGKTPRDIFLLRRVNNMSNSEIAKRYGISISSVEKYIAKAMRHCQNQMSDFDK